MAGGPGIAAGWDSLVSLTVAVIVQAVANLFDRGCPADAKEVAAYAFKNPVFASAGVGAADLTLAREASLVYLAVAVVVQAIAKLGFESGRRWGRASRSVDPYALDGTVDLAGPGGRSRRSDRTGLSHAREVLVDLSVAVVFDAIAQFFRDGDRQNRNALSSGTVGRTDHLAQRSTWPLPCHAACSQLGGPGLVCQAVAIIVESVTEFVAKGEGGVQNACRPGTILSAGQSSRAAAVPRRAWIANRVALVSMAIQIVVNSVTSLGRRVLERFAERRTPIRSTVAFVKHMDSLLELDLSHNSPEDFGPLASLDSLERLKLVGVQLEDLSILNQVPLLEFVDIRDNEVTDLGPMLEHPNRDVLRIVAYGNPVDCSSENNALVVADGGIWLEIDCAEGR